MKTNRWLWWIGAAGLFGWVLGCGPNQSSRPETETRQGQPDRGEEVIERRIRHLEAERADIKRFIASETVAYARTGSGMHYAVMESGQGAQGRVGELVRMQGEIRLLDGTLLFSAEELGIWEWRIEREEVEPFGLHEAAQVLHRGDSARIILPAHLAFGLAGAHERVPLASAVRVDLRFLP